MANIITKIHNINSKEDFIDFVQLLILDLENKPGEWENRDLKNYLDAIASWTEDMEGYYINNNLPIPQNIDWKTFANILFAAKMYE
ncbi:MAG TPA: hypothetical protein VIM65_12020 [Cyclobacteriaceae bacterium]